MSRMAKAVREARHVGSYELTELLGSGGMGEVWRAKHRLLARPAAVKLIKPEVLGAKDPKSAQELLRRFEKEAQVTASLDSPHTVELYDFGVAEDGVLFYVMELLHGVDLQTLVERFGPLPSERVIHLMMQACDSLDDAHSRGLIHRDVKPANLFVSRKGSLVDFVKLLDFGLVKRWDAAGEYELGKSLQIATSLAQHTVIGQILGTPAFLAPEAVTGEQKVDQRADIYALGCVAYWLLTKTMVFNETTTVGMAAAHVAQVPELPSRRTEQPIVPALETLIMQCLEKDRERRPKSAAILRELLSEIALPEAWTRERAQTWWTEHLSPASKAVTA
jgi:serine/threonine-protein kinase